MESLTIEVSAALKIAISSSVNRLALHQLASKDESWSPVGFLRDHVCFHLLSLSVRFLSLSVATMAVIVYEADLSDQERDYKNQQENSSEKGGNEEADFGYQGDRRVS